MSSRRDDALEEQLSFKNPRSCFRTQPSVNQDGPLFSYRRFDCSTSFLQYSIHIIDDIYDCNAEKVVL